MADGLSRPPAFVHVDLDGLWTLAGCYGFPEADSFHNDPVFDLALPRLLDLLHQLRLPATFFLCGRDLELPAKRDAVRWIVARGHELANHAYTHRFDLESLPDAELESEIARTGRAIEAIAGALPVGFRAPGYSAGPRTLAAAARLGIRYDGSRLPTPWAPVLRLLAGRLRRQVAGSPPPPASRQYTGVPVADSPDAFSSQWFVPEGGSPILRLPLAVSPVLRLPIHASLGLMLGERRVCSALSALARRGQPITWLLHGIDLLGGDDLAGRLPAPLAAQRSLSAPRARKWAFIVAVLTHITKVAEPQRTDQWLVRQSFP